MEGKKDDRSKSKRSKMKHYNHRKAVHNATRPKDTSSSSAQQTENVVRGRCGIIDVADSSDEIRDSGNISGSGWIRSKVIPRQRINPRDPLEISDDDDNDDDEDNEESAQKHAGDFNLMAQMPISAAGHFKFSSEKDWEKESEQDKLKSTEAGKYFSLNINLLNAGLNTIPFYKRIDLPSSMFSNEEIIDMENKAEEAEKNYQIVLQTHLDNKKKTKSAKSQILINDQTEADLTNKPEILTIDPKEDAELDELLNLTANQMANVKLATTATQQQHVQINETITENAEIVNDAAPVIRAANDHQPKSNACLEASKEDIQNWLDNVLDE